MLKSYLLFGIYLILYKFVTCSEGQSLVHVCQFDHIHQWLRNISSNVINVKFVCNDKVDLHITPILFTTNMTIQSLTFQGFNLEIFPNAFQNLYNLQYLKFQNCNFLFIHLAAFGDLAKMNEIDLSSNNVTMFNALWITKTSNISLLNLSHNSINYLSEYSYSLMKNYVAVINLRDNDILCHCVNYWLRFDKTVIGRIFVDNKKCPLSKECNETFNVRSIPDNSAFSFNNVTLICPITTSSILPTFIYWISPHNDIFTSHATVYGGKRNVVRMKIQPLFVESIVTVNSSTLTIEYFRGYFGGTWTCIAVSASGHSATSFVVVTAKVKLKKIFDFSVMVGFSFAGCWLLVAIVVGLLQYCRETSCCRHRIDYNKSSLFDGRYARTVFPVPVEESVDDGEMDGSDSVGGSSSGGTRNNDVQLIFTDENLADQYVQMLTDLKDASEVADENFYNRVRDLRTRVSRDFTRMRLDIKRGMQSLRSNSTAAAHKLCKGVVHMKDHMRSFTEFCGSATIAQSISVVVIADNGGHGDCPEDPPRKKTVFNFFGPLGLPR